MANPVVIDNARINLVPNKDEHKNGVYQPRTLMNRFIDRQKTALDGPYRTVKFADSLASWINTVFPKADLANLSKMLKGGWTITIFPYLFVATKETKESIETICNPPSEDKAVRRRNIVKFVSTATDAASAWGYAVGMVAACFKKTAQMCGSIFRVAGMTGFVHDVSGLSMDAQDFNSARVAAIKAGQLANGDAAVQEVHDHLVQTQRFYFLNTVKGVCAVAGFVLGLAAAATAGLAALPAVAVTAATISLVSATLAITSSLYKEGMKYKPVEFYDQAHVVRLA